MGKICGKCNENNDDSANFCLHCGARFEGDNYIDDVINIKEEEVKDIVNDDKLENDGIALGDGVSLQNNSNFASNSNNETKYEKVRYYNDKLNIRMKKNDMKIIKGFTVASIFLSIVLMIYFYNDFGFFVLLIPIFLFAVLGITYLEFIVRRKIHYHSVDALNDVMNKDKSGLSLIMFCSKCGKKLGSDARFCDNCGNSINNGNINSSSDNNKPIVSEEERHAISLCFLSYGILFLGITFIKGYNKIYSLTFQEQFFLSVIFYIIGLVVVITTKIKYPKYKKVNILLIVYILIAVLLIIALIVLMSFINSCIDSCQGLAR